MSTSPTCRVGQAADLKTFVETFVVNFVETGTPTKVATKKGRNGLLQQPLVKPEMVCQGAGRVGNVLAVE